MKLFVLVTVAFGYVAGLVRPGFIFALGLSSYPLEAALGGHSAIGVAIVAIVPLYALLVLFKRRSFHLHIVDGLFVVYFLWYCVSVLRAPDYTVAFSSLIGFTIASVGYYFATRTLLENENDFNKFAKDFLRMAVVVAIIIGLVAQPDPWSPRTHITFEGGKTMTVGVSLSFNVAICALAFYLMSKKSWQAFFIPKLDFMAGVVALIFILHFAIQNGTRGALMGPLFAVIAFSLIYSYRRLRSTTRIVMIGASIAFVLCFPIVMALIAEAITDLPPTTLPPKFKAAIINLAGVVTGMERYQAFDASGAARIDIYRHAKAIIAEWPLFGMGANAVVATIGTHAHNLLLELWSDGGIVNVVLFAAFVAAILFIGLRNSLYGPVPVFSRMFLGVASGVFIQLQVSLTLAYAKPLFFALGALVTLEVARLRARAAAFEAHTRAQVVPLAATGGAAV
ncbi:MAG: O-antigen ligase family protein [Defluviicoccus sp.]